MVPAETLSDDEQLTCDTSRSICLSARLDPKMQSSSMLSELLRHTPQGRVRRGVIAAGALVTLAIFLIDINLPLGIAGGIPYIAPVFLAIWLPDRRLIIAVAVVCSILTMAALALSPPGAEMLIVITNRLLAVAAIWIVAVLSFQRKIFETALAGSEAMNRAVLATTADGILMVDASGEIVSANPAAQRIFGYTEEELNGRPIARLLHPDSREPFARALQGRAASLARTSKAVELEVIKAGGGCIPAEAVLVSLPLGDGHFWNVTIRDISDRRLLDQHLLRERDEERRALGYSLHEELGQSITGLSLISRQLARRLESQHLAEAREASEISTLLHEVDRQALKLFQTVAPVEASGSLTDAVRELVASLNAQHETEVSLHFEGLIPPGDAFTVAQLYQVIRGLLHAVIRIGRPSELHLVSENRGSDCCLDLHVRGAAVSAEGWADLIRPHAYRARLVQAHVDLGPESPNETLISFRWSCRSEATTEFPPQALHSLAEL